MGRATVTTGKGERGFTLMELLIVVTLIVVLAGIGLSTYSTSVTRAKEAVLRENLFRMRDSIDQYYADKADVPARSHGARQRRLPATDSQGSVHRISRHVADRHVGARSGKP